MGAKPLHGAAQPLLEADLGRPACEPAELGEVHPLAINLAAGVAPAKDPRLHRPSRQPADELLALDDALDKLTEADPSAAQLVKLRYFAGLALPEAAEALGVSPRSPDRLWAYAKAWLRREMASE